MLCALQVKAQVSSYYTFGLSVPTGRFAETNVDLYEGVIEGAGLGFQFGTYWEWPFGVEVDTLARKKFNKKAKSMIYLRADIVYNPLKRDAKEIARESLSGNNLSSHFFGFIQYQMAIGFSNTYKLGKREFNFLYGPLFVFLPSNKMSMFNEGDDYYNTYSVKLGAKAGVGLDLGLNIRTNSNTIVIFRYSYVGMLPMSAVVYKKKEFDSSTEREVISPYHFENLTFGVAFRL